MTEQKVQNEYLRTDIHSIKAGQDTLSARIGELISSQQRVIDKLENLTASLDRMVEKLDRAD